MAFARRLARALLACSLALVPLAGPAAAKSEAEYHLFVWKVTPAGAADARADYLIGTMHVPVAEGLAMPAAVKTLIGAASAVVTEADTDQVKPELVAKYKYMKGPKTLKQLLPAKSWSKLVALTRPLGWPADELARLEPWYLNVGLTLPAPSGLPVIDELVKEEAERASIPVEYLESAEEQLAMMDSVRQDEDVRQLVETLDEPEQAQALLAQLRQGYFAGDQKRIEALVFDQDQLKRYPDFYKKMLFDRNARWVPKVHRLFQEEDAVVAVGLGHLLGDKGLVRLLEAKGYRVTRLDI